MRNTIGVKGHIKFIYRKRRGKLEHYIRLRFYDKDLGKFLIEHFGKKSVIKKIPDFIMYNKDLNIVQKFIIAYWKGDGCLSKKRGIVINTTSKKLALQLQLLMARIGLFLFMKEQPPTKPNANSFKNKLGIPYKCHMGYRLQSRDSRVLEYFDVLNTFNKKRATKYYLVDNNYIYVKISNLSKKEYKCKVYNAETEDHIFMINNVYHT